MDFGTMFQTWLRVLTGPGEAVFEEERASERANLTTALIWIILAAVVTAILGFLQSQLFAQSLGGMGAVLDQMDLPPEARVQMEQIFSSGAFAGLLGGASAASIVITPLFFLVGVGIYHIVARLLGGEGSYGRYAYLNATFVAPITLVNALLGFVPLAGGCLALILTIYQLVLTYFATKVEYGLSSGKAVIVVLVPVIVVVLLALCGIIVVVAVVAGLQ